MKQDNSDPEAKELFRTMRKDTEILARSLFERDKQRAHSQPNILLVLGKTEFGKEIEDALKNQPYSISKAPHLEQARQMISKNSYDAVITDDPAIVFRAGEKAIRIGPDTNLSDVLDTLEEKISSYKPTEPELEYHPQKVLIVEDDLKVARAYQQVLEDEGHTVFIADNELDAVYAISETGIDFVAADFDFDKTKETNGLTLLEKIRAYHPHVPVVIQTGKQGEEFEEIKSQARQYGAYEVIQKSASTAVRLAELVKEAQHKYHSKIRVNTQRILDDLNVSERNLTRPY